MVRLDKLVSEQYGELTRSQVQMLIKNGKVTVDGLVMTKVSSRVAVDVKTEIDANELDKPTEIIDLPILYEDENCVVINKPVGILTHSKGSFNPEGTVATWLAARPQYTYVETSQRHGIVHRLDRATSGVMICAKNPAACSHLQKQFQTRKAKKEYIARVEGVPKLQHAIIDLPIERNPKKPQTFRVGTNGKFALTEYTVIQGFKHDTLLSLRPTTGRTHQLRVHLKHLGHTIIGDTLYGGRQASRLYLHAYRLEITVPGGERKTFEAPVPEEFSATEVA